ncbi:VOC family protein [Streptomyces sp. Edi4]|uniref:VOC family protein n=1 Tax=Streptomyces sp. Edi4 TaxID=3162527 RepID=UPI003305F5DB
MADEAFFRVGLRVPDVTEAARFYQGLGFEPIGAIPGPDGSTVMAILRRGEFQLLVDALVGMPFPDNDRERMTKTGPRGLGVVIGIEVDDANATAVYCRLAGCTGTTGPLDAPWGERYFECLDPYGYAWKVFELLPDPPADGLSAARDSWFADPHSAPTPTPMRNRSPLTR